MNLQYNKFLRKWNFFLFLHLSRDIKNVDLKIEVIPTEKHLSSNTLSKPNIFFTQLFDGDLSIKPPNPSSSI